MASDFCFINMVRKNEQPLRYARTVSRIIICISVIKMGLDIRKSEDSWKKKFYKKVCFAFSVT